MSEWQSYQKSQKEWQFTKLRNSLKLNKPYVYYFANNDDLGEIETIIEEYGYKIFIVINCFLALDCF